jgi:hypothetical protein
MRARTQQVQSFFNDNFNFISKNTTQRTTEAGAKAAALTTRAERVRVRNAMVKSA